MKFTPPHDISGRKINAEKYGGWETSAIQGHTLGHYLTAVSQAYATSKDEELKKKAISARGYKITSL